MAPRGLQTENILEGSRKRIRIEKQGGSSSPLTTTTTTGAGPSAQISQQEAATDPETITRWGFKLLNVVYHARDVSDQEDPEALLVEPFLILPDKDDYPDYYQIIKKPLAFEEIRARLEQRGYLTFDELRHDCETICNNAKRYNQRDTPIWLMARALHSIIKDACAEIIDTRGQVPSTQLDANIPLLPDLDPAGVESLTSQPPSPNKTKSGSVKQEQSDPSTSAQRPATPPSEEKPAASRRITLKKKSSNAELAVGSEDQESPVFSEDESEAYGTDEPGTPVQMTPAEKRRRPFGRGKNLKSAMKQWVIELYDLKNGHGRKASEFFQELPSRDEYPDYYTVIQAPISLEEINARTAKRVYVSPYAFFNDVRIMIANAKYYNEEGSEVWRDADIIERHVEGKIIPAMLADGFTLDPKDTRSSVLPAHIAADIARLNQRTSQSQSPLPALQSGMSPPLGASKFKVKIGGREPHATQLPASLPLRNDLPAGSPPLQSSEFSGLPAQSPPAAPVVPPQIPSMSPVLALQQAGGNELSASGRPMRNAVTNPGARNLDSPQTLTSPPAPTSRPAQAASPTAGAMSPSAPIPPPGLVRLPSQAPNGAPGMPTVNVHAPQRPPQQPRQGPAYSADPRYPNAHSQQPHTQGRPVAPVPTIRKIQGPPPASIFSSARSASDATATPPPVSPLAIPAFVLLGDGLRKALSTKGLETADTRQFVVPIGERGQVKLMFKVKASRGAAINGASNGEAVEVDGEGEDNEEYDDEAADEDDDPVGDVDDEDGAPSPVLEASSSSPSATAAANGEGTASSPPPKPKLTPPRRVRAILNGRKMRIFWSGPSSSTSLSSASSEAEVATTATLTLSPLQMGTNVLEVFVRVPPPPPPSAQTAPSTSTTAAAAAAAAAVGGTIPETRISTRGKTNLTNGEATSGVGGDADQSPSGVSAAGADAPTEAHNSSVATASPPLPKVWTWQGYRLWLVR